MFFKNFFILNLRKSFFFLGIHRHFVAGIVMGYLGILINERRDRYLADRDAIFRHYVELHPEDFPPPGIVSPVFYLSIGLYA